MEKFKEIDALTIMHSLQKSSGVEYVQLIDIVKQAASDHPHGNQVVCKYLDILGHLRVIERNPSDRYSYKIIGSISNWQPLTPDYADYDIERIIEWLRSNR